MFDIYYLQSNSMFYFLVPFVLVFAIVYSALSMTSLSSNKNASTLIAVAFALFASLNPQTSAFLWNIMPYAAIILIIIFGIKLVFDLFKGKDGSKSKTDTITKLLVLLFGLFLLNYAYQNGFLSQLDSKLVENIVWVFGFIFAILIIYFGTQSESK